MSVYRLPGQVDKKPWPKPPLLCRLLGHDWWIRLGDNDNAVVCCLRCLEIRILDRRTVLDRGIREVMKDEDGSVGAC